jgi:hypothetical protein
MKKFDYSTDLCRSQVWNDFSIDFCRSQAWDDFSIKLSKSFTVLSMHSMISNTWNLEH